MEIKGNIDLTNENLSVLFIKMELKLSLCWASFWNENTTLVYTRCGRTKIQAVDSIKLFIYDNFNLCYLISMFCGLSRKATESKLKLWTASKLRAWKINYHHTNLYSTIIFKLHLQTFHPDIFHTWNFVTYHIIYIEWRCDKWKTTAFPMLKQTITLGAVGSAFPRRDERAVSKRFICLARKLTGENSRLRDIKFY